MPDLSSHHSTEFTKMLLIGDSGTGKTGSLASLAAAGYKLRIIDLDNGLDVLKNLILDPKSKYPAECIANVKYVSFQDKMKEMGGKISPVAGDAWGKTIKALSHWRDGTEDLGKPSEWGSDHIIVIDSLSQLAYCALRFHLAMNGFLGKARTQNEGRRDVGVAQNLIRDLLDMLYDSSFRCNVIMISHLTFVNEAGGNPGGSKDENNPSSGQIGVATGYPSAIGRALSPHIPRWFNNILISKAVGIGPSAQLKLFTKAQLTGSAQVITAKSTAPLRVADSYDISSGLAEYFAAIRS